jgi:hypothetical protein
MRAERLTNVCFVLAMVLAFVLIFTP